MIRAGLAPGVRAVAGCRATWRATARAGGVVCRAPAVRCYTSAVLLPTHTAARCVVPRTHLARRLRAAARLSRGRRCSSAASGGGGAGGGGGSGKRTDAELMEELTQHVLKTRESMATPYGAKGGPKPRARAAAAAGQAAPAAGAGAEAGSAAEAAATATREASEAAGESIEGETPAVRTLAQQPRFGGALGTRAAAGHKVRGYLAGADGGETPAFTPFILAFAAVMGVSVFLLYVPRAPSGRT